MSMWDAMKMDIDPITFKKMKKSDLEMLSMIESSMSEQAQRKSNIDTQMAKLRR